MVFSFCIIFNLFQHKSLYHLFFPCHSLCPEQLFISFPFHSRDFDSCFCMNILECLCADSFIRQLFRPDIYQLQLLASVKCQLSNFPDLCRNRHFCKGCAFIKSFCAYLHDILPDCYGFQVSATIKRILSDLCYTAPDFHLSNILIPLKSPV